MSDNTFKQSEPSMEDILASIRRIIAEEDEQEQRREAREQASDVTHAEDHADAAWREAGSGWAESGSNLLDEIADGNDGARATSLDTRAVETADPLDKDDDWLTGEDDWDWADGGDDATAAKSAPEAPDGPPPLPEQAAADAVGDIDPEPVAEETQSALPEDEEARLSAEPDYPATDAVTAEIDDFVPTEAVTAEIDDFAPADDETPTEPATAHVDDTDGGDLLDRAADAMTGEDWEEDVFDLGPPLPEGSVENHPAPSWRSHKGQDTALEAADPEQSFVARFEAATRDTPVAEQRAPSLDDDTMELGEDFFEATDIDAAARLDASTDDDDALELTERMIGADEVPAEDPAEAGEESDDIALALPIEDPGDAAIMADTDADMHAMADEEEHHPLDPFDDTVGMDDDGGAQDADDDYGDTFMDEAALIAAATVASESRELMPVADEPRRTRRRAPAHDAADPDDDGDTLRSRRRARLDAGDRLMSDASEAAAARAFAALTGDDDAGRRVHAGMNIGAAGGDSLEDIVREMLTPLLQDWLDENLPDVVERAVRSEVERISARARHYR